MATLRIVNAGCISNTRAAATIRSLDNFIEGTSTSSIRPVPPSTMARLRERGLLCAILQGNAEMECFIDTGTVGLQVSGRCLRFFGFRVVDSCRYELGIKVYMSTGVFSSVRVFFFLTLTCEH